MVAVMASQTGFEAAPGHAMLRRAASLALLSAALLLSACGSLPQIVPDMAYSNAPPTFSGAHGPLSPHAARRS